MLVPSNVKPLKWLKEFIEKFCETVEVIYTAYLLYLQLPALKIYQEAKKVVNCLYVRKKN